MKLLLLLLLLTGLRRPVHGAFLKRLYSGRPSLLLDKRELIYIVPTEAARIPFTSPNPTHLHPFLVDDP